MGIWSALSGTAAATARENVKAAKIKGQKANQTAAGKRAGRGSRSI